VISEAIVHAMKSLDLEYPELSPEQTSILEKYRRILENGENA
jgi:hypothetical protein